MARRDEKDTQRHFITAAAVVAVILIAASLMFLVLPGFIQRPKYSIFQSVEPSMWYQEQRISFSPADSIRSWQTMDEALLCVRYADGSPESFRLVVDAVLPNGSERSDTLQVLLLNSYGRREQSNGRMLSEISIPIPSAPLADSRLIEIFPVDSVVGICNIGLVIR